MPLLADRVQESTSTIGTGTLTLAGAVTGYRTFNASFTNGDVVYYTIDDGAGNWEVGYGTVGTGTLTRTVVLESSNANALVSFASGVKRVFNTATAVSILNASTGGTVNGALTVTGTTQVPTLTATADSAFTSTGALTVSKGTTGQQPASPVTGMIRYNTTSNQFEGYAGASPSWLPVGGSVITNDTTTATNLYPIFANATSGTATTVYTGNARLLYLPSTGQLQSTTLRSGNGLFVNSATVTESCTIATGDNASSTGPISVNSGVVVTISSGSVWYIS